MNVKQLIDLSTCTFTYLLYSNKNKEALIIDPVFEQVERDLDLIKKLNLNLIYILETHVHADHITGASKIKEKTNAKICYGSKTGVKGADIFLNDGDKILLSDFEILTIHTPGHTNGCVSYYVDNKIFSGDALFIEGTGRTDFQGGSSENIYDSVRKKLFSYPDDTIIFPGHNYKGFLSSTIGFERKFNPNVGDKISKGEFLENESKKERPYPKKFDIAVPANMKCGDI